MIEFLKRLFGGEQSETTAIATPAPPSSRPARPAKPHLPQETANEFLDWYRAQRKPAIELTPDPDKPIEPRGSRLFGPTLVLDGEDWPRDKDGSPLEFLAQLNLADCTALQDYPYEGLLQFFIGIDDLYGANFDNLMAGTYRVQLIGVNDTGALQSRPPVKPFAAGPHEYIPSPAINDDVSARGIALVPRLIEDQIDLSIHEAGQRLFELGRKYDLDALYDELDTIDRDRPNRHHTGGFPAFTQSDIRAEERNADLDHVLLRLTSDEYMMWGDVGECVFMMRSSELAKGDFSRVAYSWDCH